MLDDANGLVDIHDTVDNVHTDVGTAITNIGTIDGYHDVPAQNSAANTVVRDVVGNKTDTIAGDSLVAIAKQIKAKTDNLPADPADDSDLDTALTTIDEFHDVPAQNAVANLQMRDVIGNKTDTAAGTSLVAKVVDINADIVAVDALHNVPVQNSAANTRIRDVLGNKTDTTAGDSVYALNKQIVADTNELQTDWVNGGRLDLILDDVLTHLNNGLITRTWFSDPQTEVVADTTHTDASLPSVVLPNITGTIVTAYAGFKFRMVENTNAAANKLSGAQEIQVKENAAGAFTDAIEFVDDMFGLAASTREGGDCIIGNIDVVAEVAAFNKTYNFQWDEPLTDKDALHFNDVQTFLIVTYKPY